MKIAAIAVWSLAICILVVAVAETRETLEKQKRAERCWTQALAPARTWSDTLLVVQVVAVGGYRACPGVR